MADRTLFGDLSVTVHSGDRLGVVGINGTGKSTLLRVLAGRLDPDAGAVRQGRGVRIGVPRPGPHPSPGHGPRRGGDAAGRRRRPSTAWAWPPTSTVTCPTSPVGRPSGWRWPGSWPHRASCWCSTSPPTTSTWPPWPGSRTGWPPTAGGLVIVSHDRYLLDRVTTRMLELDRGATFLHEGGYGSYLEAQAEREEQAASAEAVPPQPGPHRAGLAAARRQGPQSQAAGPGRPRRRHSSANGRPRRPGPVTSSSRSP